MKRNNSINLTVAKYLQTTTFLGSKPFVGRQATARRVSPQTCYDPLERRGKPLGEPFGGSEPMRKLKREPPKDRKCIRCDKPISTSRRFDAKYCTDRCKYLAWEQRQIDNA